MSEKWIPEIMTPLKQDIVKMPEIIRQASGIKIFGRKIKSIIFSYRYCDYPQYGCTGSDCCISFYTASSDYKRHY